MKIDTQPEKFWDRIANNYDKEEQRDEKIHLQIIEKSIPYLRPTDTVLDFGCATGLAAAELSKYVKNIHAIDFSSKMIAIAKAKVEQQNIEFIHTTIFDDRLTPNSYDVILAFFVLHLMEDPALIIRKIHELLRPGGILLAVTPCMGNKPLLNGLFSILGRFGLVPQIKSFKLNELEQLLRRGGFEITENMLLPKTSNQYFMVSKK